MAYCCYYQAHVPQKTCWLFVAMLRSSEHIAFDRTLNVEGSCFEFFVPPVMEAPFLQIMAWLESQGLVSGLAKLPNRLAEQAQL